MVLNDPKEPKVAPTFEAEYEHLDTILNRLEGGELTLDESLCEYARGVQALQSCREILSQAELRIEELAPAETDPE